MNAKATAFFKRHEGYYTTVFNDYLDAQIDDDRLPLETRIGAWIVRRSWGNQEDFCTDVSGKNLTQADCARELNLKDRRAVNPIFRQFKTSGYIVCEGQAISPVDDPLGLNVSGRDDISENEAKTLTYSHYVEDVLAKHNPDVYKLYQEIEEKRRKIRLVTLRLYTEHLRMSQGAATIEAYHVSGRSDNESQGAGHSPDPSLLGLEPHNKKSADGVSSSVVEAPGHRASPPPPTETRLFPNQDEIKTIRDALAQYERPERDDIMKLFRVCRRADPEATAHEIALLIGEKGRKWRGPGLALFFQVVPACFPFDRAAPAAESGPPISEPTAEDLENWLAAMPEHPQAPEWRTQLETLKSQRGKAKGASA
jgi:hypothetical protein